MPVCNRIKNAAIGLDLASVIPPRGVVKVPRARHRALE